MNLQETKTNHIKMWDLMSKVTYEEIKKNDFSLVLIKESIVYKMGFKQMNFSCFLCEYAHVMKQISRGVYTCDYCLAIWGYSEPNKCNMSFYGDLINLIARFEYLKKVKQNEEIDIFMQQYKALCEKIRDVEWKE